MIVIPIRKSPTFGFFRFAALPILDADHIYQPIRNTEMLSLLLKTSTYLGKNSVLGLPNGNLRLPVPKCANLDNVGGNYQVCFTLLRMQQFLVLTGNF